MYNYYNIIHDKYVKINNPCFLNSRYTVEYKVLERCESNDIITIKQCVKIIRWKRYFQ